MIALLSAARQNGAMIVAARRYRQGQAQDVEIVLDGECRHRAEPDSFDWPVFDENTASSLCYTSGTTGHPKGVVYSHRSSVLHAMAAADLVLWDRDLHAAPMEALGEARPRVTTLAGQIVYESPGGVRDPRAAMGARPDADGVGAS